jgi:hypothetical protein
MSIEPREVHIEVSAERGCDPDQPLLRAVFVGVADSAQRRMSSRRAGRFWPNARAAENDCENATVVSASCSRPAAWPRPIAYSGLVREASMSCPR